MQMLAAMLSSVVLVLTVGQLTGLYGETVMTVMLAVVVCLCALYGLLLYLRRPHWFFMGLLTLMLILTLLLRTQLLEGFRLFWNRMSDARALGTGLLWPQWQAKLPQTQGNLYLMFFAAMLTGGICAATCYLATGAPGLLAVLLPAIALAGMKFFGTELSVGGMIAVLAAAVLVLMYSGWKHQNVAYAIAGSWILGGIAAVCLLALLFLTGATDWAAGVGERTQKAVHQHKYETERTTLPEGDFTDYQQQNKHSEAALIVTMEYPEQMYLRGFTGSVFEDDRWKPIEKELLVKNKDLLYWLNLNAFNPNAQLQAASGQMQLSTGKVTVQNLSACSRYRYVPFSLCDDGELQPEDLNTEGVLSDGSRVYSYRVVRIGAEGIAQVLQQLQQSENGKDFQYRKAESAYRQLVRNLYLQIPEEAKALLSPKWDAAAKSYGGISDLTVQQAQECALRFLSQCFAENGIPEDMKLPLDCVRGTTYQYATVAVLTLRYFGIPSRYAEGYLITENMAATVQSGETLAVDSSCARAWAEIYQDGIGWIPMDMTPGFGEMIQENPEDNTGEGDSETENEELDPEEAEDDSPMEEDMEIPDPNGGSVVRIMTIVLTSLLKILLILLAAFLILFFRRRYINGKREKKFCAEAPKDAVGWIFADVIAILQCMGIHVGENGSLRQLHEPVQKKFGDVYACELDRMITVNDRALFSSRSMKETQRNEMLEFRLETIEKATEQIKWYKRLWLKWVRCLY